MLFFFFPPLIQKLGPNELGEILCLSPSAFKGYLGDGGGGDSLFDSEGFFRTGDLGWYDRGGVLHYQDRIKVNKYSNWRKILQKE